MVRLIEFMKCSGCGKSTRNAYWRRQHHRLYLLPICNECATDYVTRDVTRDVPLDDRNPVVSLITGKNHPVESASMRYNGGMFYSGEW